MITKEKLAVFTPAVPALLLLLSGILLLLTDGLPFSAMILETKQKDINALKLELQYTQSDIDLFRNDLSGFREIFNSAINLPLKDAENLFREQISGIQIKNIGPVRSTAINEFITVFEIKFTASGTISEVTDFLAGAASGIPRLYWRSIYIEPDSAISADHVSLTGTVSAFNFIPVDPETAPEVVVP